MPLVKGTELDESTRAPIENVNKTGADTLFYQSFDTRYLYVEKLKVDRQRSI